MHMLVAPASRAACSASIVWYYIDIRGSQSRGGMAMPRAPLKAGMLGWVRFATTLAETAAGSNLGVATDEGSSTLRRARLACGGGFRPHAWAWRGADPDSRLRGLPK